MALSDFIKADHLQYTYPRGGDRRALNHLDLEIGPDEYLLVCGASGSGKSTLCRTFNGLIPHFYDGSLRGQVFVAGTSTADQSIADLSARVGMVFQNPEAQLFNSNVELEIAFGLESLGLPREEIKNRIAAVTEMTGIDDLLRRNPHALSSGEQQLVSIAAVLAADPQTIVLDEPYANLDHLNVRRVRQALAKIHCEGKGVIVCEHRLALTVKEAQRMTTLQRGRIVLDGPPRQVLQQDVEAYGLKSPLSALIGRRLGLIDLPLDVSALQKQAPSGSYPPDLKPELLPPPAGNAPVVLEVEKVSSRLAHALVLRDVSFRLHRGECLAVVGANGAGKTTLLKHLNGLLRPADGRIRVMGRDTRKERVSQLARHVGMAFQNPDNQFFKLTVLDEITVGSRVLGRYDQSWLQELIVLFGLKPLLERSPYRLSGGEKKRVAFAAALACKPDILALDEPTAGQDFDFRRALGEILKHLRNRGQAVLLVTHDLSFAEQHAHRWLLMSRGRIIAEGKPWQVMADKQAMDRANLEPTDAFRVYAHPTGREGK